MIHDQVIFRLPGENHFHFWKGTVETHAPDSLGKQIDKDIYMMKPFCGNDIYILHPTQKTVLTPRALMNIKLQMDYKNALITDNITQANYISFIEEAVAAIRSGIAEKMVLARKYYQEQRKQFLWNQAINQLHQVYPNAFISCLQSESLGSWLGASPEVLLTNTDQGWETVALAGTQKIEASNTWGTKETLEHAMVMKYVEEVLQSHHLEHSRSNIDSIQMGHLSHIYVSYHGNKKLDDGLAAKLIHALSPTPAVCGIPKDTAQEYIIQHEPFDRELYTGCWGPRIAGNWHVYVNLRCTQIYQNHLAFYAGGGINSMSDPEAEWFETVEKIKLLSEVLETF